MHTLNTHKQFTLKLLHSKLFSIYSCQKIRPPRSKTDRHLQRPADPPGQLADAVRVQPAQVQLAVGSGRVDAGRHHSFRQGGRIL